MLINYLTEAKLHKQKLALSNKCDVGYSDLRSIYKINLFNQSTNLKKFIQAILRQNTGERFVLEY